MAYDIKLEMKISRVAYCKICSKLEPKKNPHPLCSWSGAFIDKKMLTEPADCPGFSRFKRTPRKERSKKRRKKRGKIKRKKKRRERKK